VQLLATGLAEGCGLIVIVTVLDNVAHKLVTMACGVVENEADCDQLFWRVEPLATLLP